MKFRHLIFLFLLFSVTNSFCQKLIFEEIPDKILRPPLYGMRGVHYVHFFYEVGIPSGVTGSDTLKIKNLRSTAFNFGLRYKIKISRKLAFISELSYRFKSYNVIQNGNRFPDTLNFKKEKLNFNQANGSLAFRYIYGKKKTYFGSYIDFGASYAWTFNASHYTKQQINNPDPEIGKQIIRIRNKHLKYVLPTETDIYIGFGFEKFQFRMTYRISDYFSTFKGVKVPELPRFIYSLNFAITGN